MGSWLDKLAMSGLTTLFHSLLLSLMLACFTACGDKTPPPAPVEDSPFVLNVILAEDARLPLVDRGAIEGALADAEKMIETATGRRVKFSIARVEPVDSYLEGHFRGAVIPASWQARRKAFWHADDRALRALIERAGSDTRPNPIFLKEVLSELLPDSRLIRLGDAAGNRRQLYDRFFREFHSIAGEKTVDDAPVVDRVAYTRHSLSSWSFAFNTIRPRDVRDHIVITNTPVFADEIEIATPYSLIRGGLVVGCAFPPFGQAVISTFGIWSDGVSVARLRDGEYSDSERRAILAHTLAHEIGTHLVKGGEDAHGHSGCLDVPAAGLAFRRLLARFAVEPKCTLKHAGLDLQELIASRYIFLAGYQLEAGHRAEAILLAQEGLRDAPASRRLAEFARELAQLGPAEL